MTKYECRIKNSSGYGKWIECSKWTYDLLQKHGAGEVRVINEQEQTDEQQRTTYANYEQQAMEGTLPDNENPIFILSSTSTKLLTKIVSDEIDMVTLAKLELANRGINLDGKWVGFEEAKKNLKQF